MGEQEPSYIELDARHNDGKTIQLLWEAETNTTSIRIEEDNNKKVIQFTVLGEKAMQAFNHPYAFAPPEAA